MVLKMWNHAQIIEMIENYNINFLNVIFICFTFTIVVFGSLIALVESYLPVFLRQSFRYGKHCYKGKGDPLINSLEVPKSWFKHFYIFAFAWSLLALYLMLNLSFIPKAQASESVLWFLDLIAGKDRPVLISSSCAFIATVLIALQCARRFYETNFVQIFSQGKINLSHYIVGYTHYFGTILALLVNTEGFVRDTTPSSFSLSNITLLQYLCILFFYFAWFHQYKSNMILVNIRKDPNTGNMLTERHFLPRGGFFEMLSSPHMFFEIVMYSVIWGLLWQSTTWLYIVIWVLSNQLVNALLAHRWYKENFKNYPKTRYAVLPFIL